MVDIREACDAGVFVSRAGGIRVAGIRRRPKVEAARRRRAKDAWVSGRVVSGGVEELASGLQATAVTRRLTRPSRASDAPRFVVARTRKSDLLAHMEPYMWNRGDADIRGSRA